MTVKKDLTIDQGFTWNFHADYVYEDEPINLTGHTVTLEVKRATGTVIDTYTATANAEGEIDVTVTDEDTALYPSAPLEYSLIVEQPDGNKFRIARGGLKVIGR